MKKVEKIEIGFTRKEVSKSMCGRYYVDDEMAQMIAKTIGEIEGEWSQRGRRDIYPSEKAGIIEKRHHWIMREMEWGMKYEVHLHIHQLL